MRPDSSLRLSKVSRIKEGTEGSSWCIGGTGVKVDEGTENSADGGATAVDGPALEGVVFHFFERVPLRSIHQIVE